MFYRSLDPLAKRTMRGLMVAAPFEGLLMVGLHLGATIARKSLGATDQQIMLLMMVAPICFLMSVYWAEWIRLLQKWRRLFLACALFSSVPFFFMYPFGTMGLLLAVLLFFEMSTALFMPLRNRVMQSNLPLKERSRLYGHTAALASLVVLLVSWPLGRFLDLDPGNWRWFFVGIGLAGGINRILWYLLPENPDSEHTRPVLSSPQWMGEALPRWRRLTTPIHRMKDVLVRNRAFFRWEMQFMLYGLAFFIIMTVTPGYLVEGLGLSYSTISVGQIGLARLGGVLTLPLMGMLHDRHDPASFCARIFFLLAFAPLLLASCYWLDGGRLVAFYMAYFLQGVAMSGVMVAWSMSSLAFARDEDGALYQSIHVSLTGMRGLIGPALGWFVKETFGWTAAFLLASFLLFVASALMAYQGRSLRSRFFET
jgi:MFS family permease